MTTNDGMAIELNGTKKALFTVSIFLLSICVMGEMGVMPITFNIYEVFGDGFVANYIVSAAALWMAIGAMLSTKLMETMTKKKILLIGAIVFAVGSIFCATIVNGVYISVMRSLMGLGEGIINTVAMAYIAQMYVDEGKRAAFTGYFNAAGTVFGAILSYAGGALSIPEWTHTFYVYFPMVLVVIATFLFIPELGMEEVVDWGTETTGGKKEPMGLLYATFILDYVIFVAMYACISYFISVYIAETGIGDGAFAGTVLSVSTIAGFFSAAAFGPIYGKLGKNTATVAIAAAAVSLALLWAMPSKPVALVACGLIGAVYGAYFSYSYAYVGEIVPMSRVNDAMGYTTAIYSLAFFATPFVVSALMGLTQGQVRPLYAGAAVLGCVGVAVELATNGAYKKLRESQQQ